MNDQEAKKSLAPEYFENVYNAKDDPWDFASSEYEAAKYAATLDALPREKYDVAFEVGCSIGVLTAKLAARCAALLSVDVNEKALNQARARCHGLTNVKLELRQVPEEFPEQSFDLILISEVGYYLSAEDWKKTFEKVIAHLKPHGNVALVHWTPPVHDYPQTGDEVHDSFAEWGKNELKLIKEHRTKEYRLDVWERI